jgi:hypothetical protein
MSVNPIQPEVNLEQLAAEIRLDCVAVEEAGRCALDRAIAAGKRLLQVKEHIDHGFRQWLKQHGFNKTNCYDFMLLARNEESVRSSGHISIAAALRMLRAKSGRNRSSNKTYKSNGSPLTKAAWNKATIAERRQFLDAIGVDSVLEAVSFAFRAELKRRVAGQQAAKVSALSEHIAAAIRQALSCQKSAQDNKDAPAMGVVSALGFINNKLAKAGLDLNNITAVTIDAAATRRAA